MGYPRSGLARGRGVRGIRSEYGGARRRNWNGSLSQWNEEGSGATPRVWMPTYSISSICSPHLSSLSLLIYSFLISL
jgi:hypothetical protein